MIESPVKIAEQGHYVILKDGYTEYYEVLDTDTNMVVDSSHSVGAAYSFIEENFRGEK